MESFSREVFRSAILRENSMLNLFSHMSSVVDDNKSREVFAKMAEDERRHKNCLMHLDISGFKDHRDFRLRNAIFDMRKGFSIPGQDDLVEPKKAIRHAISECQQSYESYSNLAASLPSCAERDILRDLALEEADHRMELMRIRDGMENQQAGRETMFDEQGLF